MKAASYAKLVLLVVGTALRTGAAFKSPRTAEAQGLDLTFRQSLIPYLQREMRLSTPGSTRTANLIVREVNSDYVLFVSSRGARYAVPFSAIYMLGMGDSDDDTPRILVAASF